MNLEHIIRKLNAKCHGAMLEYTENMEFTNWIMSIFTRVESITKLH